MHGLQRTLIVAAGAVSVLALCGSAAALPPNVSRQQVLGGLNQPVTVDFIPGDGRMLVLHKPGHILIADPTTLPATTSNYLTLTDIDTGGFERGLMAIAFDPAFETNGHFYLYYSHASSGRFRISRFTHSGDHADPASEVFVWENNTSWGSHSHYGGGMGFGPDGKLYLTIGDDFDPTTSQDLSLADGKLIRINSDGTIPADNPFVGQPGVLPEIWAYGLRNPFRAKWDLPTGRFIIGEVGGNDQATAWEDVCIGVAGANYGWPECEGFCDNPEYEDPIFTYPHLGVAACMTGGMVYRGSQFSNDYYGAYFYADYSRGWVRYLTFEEDGVTVASDTEFDTGVNAIVDFQTGPDGAIYYARLGPGQVWRYVYDDGNQPPSITGLDAQAPVATAPVSVNFSAVVNDPEMDPLEYTWIFGDGEEATGSSANVSHTYEANGVYTAYLRVTDPTHVVLSEPITVQIGLPPQATITAPIDGALFRAGDQVTFAGFATDPDGSLGPENFAWTSRFIHAGHSHGTSTPTSGTGGSFTVPTTGHEFASDTHYEIILTVTDADGLTDQQIVRVYPETVHVTVESTPPGARILWDGNPLSTPFTRETVINFQHTISAATRFCLNGGEYAFSTWSDGSVGVERALVVPESDVSLAATFGPTGQECELPVEDGLVAWYRSDVGVSVAGGVVTGWQDQSGYGNDMVGAGQPQLVAGAINGFASIRLDGIDDRVERVAPDSLAQLPGGNADRTMFAIVKYNGGGFGGITYGSAGCNEVFGLSVTPDGKLMIHGWCGENDFISAAQGTNAGWMLNEVVYDDNIFRHYKDGALINTGTHSFGTTPTRLVLGAEIDTTPHVALEVAELLIYNRALSDAERVSMEDYLHTRYFVEPCVYDLDGNRDVDVFDLLLFLDDWFTGCP